MDVMTCKTPCRRLALSNGATTTRRTARVSVGILYFFSNKQNKSYSLPKGVTGFQDETPAPPRILLQHRGPCGPVRMSRAARRTGGRRPESQLLALSNIRL